MIHGERGVADKLTDDDYEVYGHGTATADAIRQRVEQPCP